MAGTSDWRINDSQFKRKLAALKTAGPSARLGATLALAHEVGLQVVRTARRDTNRFVRAAAQAFNQAGAGPVPVASVQAGKKSEQVLKRLLQQVLYWKGVIQYHEEHGQTAWKSYRRALKRLETARKYLEDWSPEAAAIGLESYQRRSSRVKGSKADVEGILTKVYSKVYGGEGRIIAAGTQTVVQLVNKEPHAIIVERRDRTMADAISQASGRALKKAHVTYVQAVASQAGMKYKVG